MILDSLQNNLEELQSKHPEYAGLVGDTEFILMWFKILAKDTRRNCDQECRKMLTGLQNIEFCNYYDPQYNKCILDMLLHDQ